MQFIAKFEKVSLRQFQADCEKLGFGKPYKEIAEAWDNLILPKRATTGSAGYDFFLPFSVEFARKLGNENYNRGFDDPFCDWVTIPTGVRCQMNPEYFLMLLPKSGLGYKYGFRLANTCGVADSDYYGSDNEGHITAKVTTENPLVMDAGFKYMQGIFIPYGVVVDDDAKGVRNGGFGSTGR